MDDGLGRTICPRGTSRGLLRRFLRDTRGAFVLMFAIVLLPIITAVGMALDYGFAANIKSQLQNALDSAVLAATSSLTAASDDDEITEFVKTLIAANLKIGMDRVNVSVTVEHGSRTVIVDGTVDQQTYLLPIVGIDHLKVRARTKAALGRAYIELALVLDNSGSMEGARITRLRKAAKDMAKTVIDLGYAYGDTRVALVPFAGMVNVGAANATKSWMDRFAASPVHSENFATPANRFSLYDSMARRR